MHISVIVLYLLSTFVGLWPCESVIDVTCATKGSGSGRISNLSLVVAALVARHYTNTLPVRLPVDRSPAVLPLSLTVAWT